MRYVSGTLIIPVFALASSCQLRLISVGESASEDPSGASLSVPQAPALTAVSDRTFPSNQLLHGSALSVDFDDENVAGDEGVSYACTFDRTVDDAVTAGTDCSLLPGSTAAFDPVSGTLSWTPSIAASAFGAYEIKVLATNSVGTAERVFVVDVADAYLATSLSADLDAQFGATISPQDSSASSWLGMTTDWMTALLVGTAGTPTSGFAGAGTYSDPHRVTLDGVDDRINLGTIVSMQPQISFSGWFRPGSLSSNKVILGNRDPVTGNGLALMHYAPDYLTLKIGRSYADAVLEDSPLIFMRLDEYRWVAWNTTQEAFDTSANGLSGWFNGTEMAQRQAPAPTTDGRYSWSFGPHGCCGGHRLMWDPTNFVFSAAGQDLPFSVEAWVRTTTTGIIQPIFTRYYNNNARNYQFQIDASNRVGLRLFGDVSDANNDRLGRLASAALAQNTWYHVVATYDGSETEAGIKIYIDGVRADDTTDTSAGSYTGFTPDMSTWPMIGTNQSEYFQGNIDEVAVYGSELGAARVADHYAARNTGASCSIALKGQWTTSRWAYVSGSYDGTTLSLQLDGRHSCTANVSGGYTLPTGSFYVGANSDGSQAWNGAVAELKVYSSATGASSNYEPSHPKFNSPALNAQGILTEDLLLLLDANAADGSAPYSAGGCGAGMLSWTALHGGFAAALTNFTTCTTYGWHGSGTAADPYHVYADGVDDRLSIPDNDRLSFGDGAGSDTAFTIETWVNLAAVSGRALVGKRATDQSEYEVNFTGGGRPRLNLYTQYEGARIGRVTVNALPLNSWQHLVFTYDGSEASTGIRIFFNGTEQTYNLDAAGTYAGSALPNGSATLSLFSRPDGTGAVEGKMNLMRIYGRALTPAQISANCSAQAARFSGAVCN